MQQTGDNTMPRQALAFRTLIAFAGAAVIAAAASSQAAPPVGNYQGGTYPSYAYSLYPAYRPSSSFSSPGPYASPGYYRYYGYVPNAGYNARNDPGFAQFYARVGPASGPPTSGPTHFYIPSAGADEETARPADTTAHIKVLMPAGADLWFDGWKSRSTGAVRKLQSPPLTPGRRYTYTVRAHWEENGREVTQTQQVAVSAGAHVVVNFPVSAKNDGKDEGVKDR
jgi:uncharacterized protein (TIGR03000 family)